MSRSAPTSWVNARTRKQNVETAKIDGPVHNQICHKRPIVFPSADNITLDIETNGIKYRLYNCTSPTLTNSIVAANSSAPLHCGEASQNIYKKICCCRAMQKTCGTKAWIQRQGVHGPFVAYRGARNRWLQSNCQPSLLHVVSSPVQMLLMLPCISAHLVDTTMRPAIRGSNRQGQRWGAWSLADLQVDAVALPKHPLNNPNIVVVLLLTAMFWRMQV